MKLSSSAFNHEGSIPQVYTCQGQEINPPLEIHDVPAKTKSLALIMDDPDVPASLRKDQMWVHWVVYNIDPLTTHIDENSEPFATYGKNTGGTSTYQGPCPPDREHRYFFKLYALDALLNLPADITKEALEYAMRDHILESTELMGRYNKT